MNRQNLTSAEVNRRANTAEALGAKKTKDGASLPRSPHRYAL